MAISVQSLTKVFGTESTKSSPVRALDNVNLEVRDNEFVTLLGPSGCGKTTLLRMIAGLETIEEGDIAMDDVPVRKPSPERAMVFQHFALLPWANVLRNVAFGLELGGMPKAERNARAAELVKMVGLQGFEESLPAKLSGGMQQRVGLARVLAVDPKVLLMDEPFGALDEQTKRIMQTLLLEIWERDRKTVVFVTHSIDEALLLGDRVVIMSPRPGRIHEILDVPLPRPRDHDIEAQADYIELRSRLWDTLMSMQSSTSGTDAPTEPVSK